MWLLLMVEVITPNVIDIWEAFITFAMFPTLVTISWLANKGKLPWLALEKQPGAIKILLVTSVPRPQEELQNGAGALWALGAAVLRMVDVPHSWPMRTWRRAGRLRMCCSHGRGHHPRLKMRASVAVPAMLNNRKSARQSHVNAEVPKEHGEDKAPGCVRPESPGRRYLPGAMARTCRIL